MLHLTTLLAQHATAPPQDLSLALDQTLKAQLRTWDQSQSRGQASVRCTTAPSTFDMPAPLP